MKKTNAARILETQGISFTLREYPVDEADLSAGHVAEQLGLPPAQVFKTLVVSGDKTGVLLAVVPASAELDLHKLAAASGNKKVALVPLKDVQTLTGYLRGGVSPIGTKKRYPVYLDDTMPLFPYISVSAGLRGMQVLLAPEDLQRVIEGTLAELT